MKRILFIPTYTYLSSPIFSNLLNYLEKYETIYLDVEEQFNAPKTSKNFQEQFRKVVNITKIDSNNQLKKIYLMYKFQTEFISYIENEIPSIIITTSDLSFSVRILKKYFPSIPIIIIQSAFFSNSNLENSFKHNMRYFIFNKLLGLPFIAKQNYFAKEYKGMNILVWGTYFKDMINNSNNIEVIGDITFDTFPIKDDIELKKELLLKYNFDINSKIVIICTSVLGSLASTSTINKLYDIYKNLIIEKENIFFIIKPHPREQKNRLTNFIEEKKPKNAFITDEHLHSLFQYTDIHISSFSRTALESLASNIPILSVNPNNEIKLKDFFNNEINEKVETLDEIIFKIDKLLNSKDEFMQLREKYITKMLYELDSKATQRAIKIIENKIKD